MAINENFLFLSVKNSELLNAGRKILLTFLMVIAITYDPGASENPLNISDKLLLANLRLTNSFSSGPGFERGEDAIRTFMHRWTIEGASVAIAREGRLVYAKGFGFSDTARREVTQPFNKFRIASISKLVTAVAVMKLKEEGKLSLDDKVFGPAGILNDTAFCHPRDKRVFNITVAHLLSHEGGWTQRWGDQMFMPLVIARQMNVMPPIDLKTIVRFALSKRLHYTPGTGRAYSNLGYSILGLVIEKVSGMPYNEYCRKEIFEPLGIYDMMPAKNLVSEKAPFEVTYYEPAGMPLKPSIYGNGEMVPTTYGGNDIEALGAAGSWLATTPDLMRLLLAIDGFSTRTDLLSDESIRFMTDLNNNYAPVGWKAATDDGTWIRTGSFSGTEGMMKRQPDGISWVVLLNSSTWNGPEIHSYVDRMMTRFISQISEWPDYDLFENSLPLPLKIELSGIN
jgi:CubicO group peptidase (beta-lactamase class C family)